MKIHMKDDGVYTIDDFKILVQQHTENCVHKNQTNTHSNWVGDMRVLRVSKSTLVIGITSEYEFIAWYHDNKITVKPNQYAVIDAQIVHVGPANIFFKNDFGVSEVVYIPRVTSLKRIKNIAIVE